MMLKKFAAIGLSAAIALLPLAALAQTDQAAPAAPMADKDTMAKKPMKKHMSKKHMSKKMKKSTEPEAPAEAPKS